MSISVKNFIFSLALVLVPVLSLKSTTELRIKFMNDFLANENKPSTIVVGSSQWTMPDMVEFSKCINLSVKFLRAGETIKEPLDEYVNTIVFFIDMKSAGSVKFVQNVNQKSLFKKEHSN